MNRKSLEKPFDLSLVKQRKGNHGDTLDYVERRTVIQRLNNTYDGLWNLEIVNQHIFDTTANRQLTAIFSIGKSKGPENRKIKAISLKVLNKDPEFLTKEEASSIGVNYTGRRILCLGAQQLKRSSIHM